MTLPITGLVAAPHTPMRADGSLALDVIPRQATLYRTAGLSGAFVCGTTGESMSLSSDERRLVAEAWCDVAGAGLQVIVHVGHNSIPEARELAAHAADAGADAIAVTAPSFFRAADLKDLAIFCAEIAEAAPGVPFFYYHIPSLTNAYFPIRDLLPELAARVPDLAGVKYTHDDLADCLRCMRWEQGRLSVLWGRDEMLLGALASGARGAVGSTYNFASPLYHAIVRAFESGEREEAIAQQARAADLCAILNRFGGIAAGKALMKWIGINCGTVRAPLRPLSEKDEKALFAAVEAAGLRDALQWETGLEDETASGNGAA